MQSSLISKRHSSRPAFRSRASRKFIRQKKKHRKGLSEMAAKTKKKTTPPVKRKTVRASMTSGKKDKQTKKTETKGKKETKRPAKKQLKKALKPRKESPKKKLSIQGVKTKTKQKKTVKPQLPSKKKPSRAVKATISATGKPTREEILRRQLIQRREEIVREAKSEIARNTKGEANQVFETVLDDGDLSVVDLSADINLRLLETHRERLLRIDEALRKLREGSYGTCEDCGEEITAERLNVMPFAIYCRDCQETREVMEKVAKEEEI